MGLVDHEKSLLCMTTCQIQKRGQTALEPKEQYQKQFYNSLVIGLEMLDMDDLGKLGELVSSKDPL